MDKRELITKVLSAHSCLTAMEIKGFAYRMFNEEISPNSASGQLRTMIREGKAASSKNLNNKTVYWLVKKNG